MLQWSLCFHVLIKTYCCNSKRKKDAKLKDVYIPCWFLKKIYVFFHILIRTYCCNFKRTKDAKLKDVYIPCWFIFLIMSFFIAYQTWFGKMPIELRLHNFYLKLWNSKDLIWRSFSFCNEFFVRLPHLPFLVHLNVHSPYYIMRWHWCSFKHSTIINLGILFCIHILHCFIICIYWIFIQIDDIARCKTKRLVIAI
jgi:hypothetical protein